jgi:hypothetical protein
MLLAILFMFTHWLGDFVLQTNSMALNKHKSIKWLTVHVLAYSVPLTIVSLSMFDWVFGLKFILINAALHWIIDFITSRVANSVRDKPRLYYPIIGFDQFLHALCLLGSYQLMSGSS